MNNLKELRINENLTQKEIAEKLNITQFTYSNYETGFTEPNIETLKKLADFYSVSLDYLVGREFTNDVGFLSNEEKEIILNIKRLNEINKIKAISFIMGLLAIQN